MHTSPTAPAPCSAACGAQDNFIPFYVFTAVRKFLVFLDPKKTGELGHVA